MRQHFAHQLAQLGMGLEPGLQLLLGLGTETHRQRRGGGIGGKAATGIRQAVGIGNVGFDIDDGGAIEQIHRPQLQPQLAPFATDPVQFDHREAERIGAEGGASGKDADPLVAAKARRAHRRVPALRHGLVKDEAEPQMGELLDAAQHIRLIVRGEQLEAGASRFDQTGLAGDGELLLVGRADDPEGVDFELHGGS